MEFMNYGKLWKLHQFHYFFVFGGNFVVVVLTNGCFRFRCCLLFCFLVNLHDAANSFDLSNILPISKHTIHFILPSRVIFIYEIVTFFSHFNAINRKVFFFEKILFQCHYFISLKKHLWTFRRCKLKLSIINWKWEVNNWNLLKGEKNLFDNSICVWKISRRTTQHFS